MGTGVVAQGQLQDVLEIVGAHDLIVPVRQAVRVQRYQRRRDNREQAEASPGDDQRQQVRP